MLPTGLSERKGAGYRKKMAGNDRLADTRRWSLNNSHT